MLVTGFVGLYLGCCFLVVGSFSDLVAFAVLCLMLVFVVFCVLVVELFGCFVDRLGF